MTNKNRIDDFERVKELYDSITLISTTRVKDMYNNLKQETEDWMKDIDITETIEISLTNDPLSKDEIKNKRVFRFYSNNTVSFGYFINDFIKVKSKEGYEIYNDELLDIKSEMTKSKLEV